MQHILQEVEDRGAVGTFASMQFIDFEYGGYAYRGHDWGNHFAEYAGFECEYSRYPDNEQVELFVRAYLNEGASTPAVSALSKILQPRMMSPPKIEYCYLLELLTLLSLAARLWRVPCRRATCKHG